jgi:uncharacterized membrane protein
MNEDLIYRSLQAAAILVILIIAPSARRYADKKGWRKAHAKREPNTNERNKELLKTGLILGIIAVGLIIIREMIRGKIIS